jgi:hypothetical protein
MSAAGQNYFCGGKPQGGHCGGMQQFLAGTIMACCTGCSPEALTTPQNPRVKTTTDTTRRMVFIVFSKAAVAAMG